MADEDYDPFESILFAEDKAHQLGFKEGYSHGIQQGFSDGYHTGYEKGWQIGEEIGFYLGFAETWLNLVNREEMDKNEKERKNKLLSGFVTIVKEFSLMNIHETEYTYQLQQLRAKYKQIISVLKLTLELDSKSKKKSLTF